MNERDAAPPRIAVTGLGAVCGFGADVPALLAGLRRGASALSTLTTFDVTSHRTQLASQVAQCLDGVAPRGLSRGDRLALCAAREAVAHAGLAAHALTAAGVFFGSSNGGFVGHN